MGFFSRKKTVPLDHVATFLAEQVLASGRREKAEAFLGEFLEDNSGVTEGVANDWLALHLFAVVTAAGDAFDSKAAETKLLDRVHAIVYRSVFRDDDAEGAAFENLLQDRYGIYSRALAEGGWSGAELGRCVAKNLGAPDDAGVIYVASKSFSNLLTAGRNYLGQVAEYEFV